MPFKNLFQATRIKAPQTCSTAPSLTSLQINIFSYRSRLAHERYANHLLSTCWSEWFSSPDKNCWNLFKLYKTLIWACRSRKYSSVKPDLEFSRLPATSFITLSTPSFLRIRSSNFLGGIFSTDERLTSSPTTFLSFGLLASDKKPSASTTSLFGVLPLSNLLWLTAGSRRPLPGVWEFLGNFPLVQGAPKTVLRAYEKSRSI